jgi:hypothetical protein
MIVCRQCGKKKKVQRLPAHHATWECSTCAKARAGHKVAIACFHCHKEIAIRPSKVCQSQYYLCGRCVKLHGTHPLDGLRQPGQILIRTLNAAGEMEGVDLRYPTREEAASVERAKLIRDIGIAQLQRERALQEGMPLHHHLN